MEKFLWQKSKTKKKLRRDPCCDFLHIAKEKPENAFMVSKIENKADP